MNDSKLVYLLVGVFVGFLITIATVKVSQTSFERHVRVSALANSIAGTVFSQIPLLYLSEQEADISEIQAAVRLAVTAGIARMYASVEVVDEQTKETVISILESIARDREKLGLGNYAAVPQPHIEEILAQYSAPVHSPL